MFYSYRSEEGLWYVSFASLIKREAPEALLSGVSPCSPFVPFKHSPSGISGVFLGLSCFPGFSPVVFPH